MDIDLIGIPMDYGAGRRGVDMGPSAIRYAGLRPALEALGHSVQDLGDLKVPLYESHPSREPNLRHLECIVEVCRHLARLTAETALHGRIPICMGGDHSLALGSIHGVSRHKHLGVIWVDAHGDFNTGNTTPSGNIHGMPLAALAGLGDERLVGLGESRSASVNPAHIAVLGARDIDPGERQLLRQAGVAVFSMDQIDRQGMYTVVRQALESVLRGTEGIYLSLDLDALDPVYAPGVGTSVPGGLTYREAHLLCEVVAESGKLAGLDLVEVNPILDERNRTASMAVGLLASALGKRVW